MAGLFSRSLDNGPGVLEIGKATLLRHLTGSAPFRMLGHALVTCQLLERRIGTIQVIGACELRFSRFFCRCL